MLDSTLTHHEEIYDGDIVEATGSMTAKVWNFKAGKTYYLQVFADKDGQTILGDTIEFRASGALVSSFQPNEGVAGTKVTIMGSDFTYS